MGARIREHRASIILSLESLDIEAQMTCAAAFLNALFDAPREHWFPALVVVDEAQMFAPSVAGDVADNVRRASLGAMVGRSEEHTSELQSLMRISSAVFCLKKKHKHMQHPQ